MRALILGAVGVVAAGGLAAMLGGEPKPERVGHFKSEDGNRVMAYIAPPNMSDDEAKAFLGGVMHTPGQLTLAAIYSEGVRHPGHKLTSSPDYLTAASLLDSAAHDDWSWSVLIKPTGALTYQAR